MSKEIRSEKKGRRERFYHRGGVAIGKRHVDPGETTIKGRVGEGEPVVGAFKKPTADRKKKINENEWEIPGEIWKKREGSCSKKDFKRGLIKT